MRDGGKEGWRGFAWERARKKEKDKETRRIREREKEIVDGGREGGREGVSVLQHCTFSHLCALYVRSPYYCCFP